eukprot:PhF_6_TR40712/c0_g1_i1/m.61219
MSARDLPLLEVRLQTLQHDLDVAITAVHAAGDAFTKLSESFGAMFELLHKRNSQKSSNVAHTGWCLKMIEKDLDWTFVRSQVKQLTSTFTDTMKESNKLITDCKSFVVEAKKFWGFQSTLYCNESQCAYVTLCIFCHLWSVFPASQGFSKVVPSSSLPVQTSQIWYLRIAYRRGDWHSFVNSCPFSKNCEHGHHRNKIVEFEFSPNEPHSKSHGCCIKSSTKRRYRRTRK